MYKDKIEGKDLKKIIKNLPEKYHNKTLEITIKEYTKDNISQNVKNIINKIRKRVVNRSYLGKSSEVFFFDSDELDYDEIRDIKEILKSYGYNCDIKSGQRNTLVINVTWDNIKI